MKISKRIVLLLLAIVLFVFLILTIIGYSIRLVRNTNTNSVKDDNQVCKKVFYDSYLLREDEDEYGYEEEYLKKMLKNYGDFDSIEDFKSKVIWQNLKTDISNYEEGVDYQKECSGLYLKYDIEDSKVVNTYVVDSFLGITLKSGKESYEDNKKALKKIIDSNECYEDHNKKTGVSYNGFSCRRDEHGEYSHSFNIINLSKDGYISVTSGSGAMISTIYNGCSISQDGKSVCTKDTYY